MPPLDNSHTQFSLVPESVFDNSSSFQMARTYFMPDYQRNLVGKQFGGRVNDGGSSGGDRGCSTYGLLDSCGAHRVGKGTKHPIAGLTCYEECVCDTSYYKYTASNCRSPKKLSESCSDIKKTTIADGALAKKDTVAELSKTLSSSSLAGSLPGVLRTVKYAQCNCPAEYNLSSCPTNANCETCDSKHKFISCKDGYTMTSRGTCEAMSCSSYGGYDVCPAGYGVTDNFSTPAGNHCVKCSKCVAGTYSKGTGPCVAWCLRTYSSQAGASSCTACASGSYQTATGQTSCKTVAHADGWTISANKCSITKKSCAAVNRRVTTCSKGAYSSGGYSGDEVCGKCTLNDTCLAGYSKTACTSNQQQVGTTTTEAGSTCYKCKEIACPIGKVDANTYWCTVPVTDCETLGYKSGLCLAGHKVLNCPFDSSKVACF